MKVEVHLSYYGYHYKTIVSSPNTHSAGRVALLYLPDWVDPLQVTFRCIRAHTPISDIHSLINPARNTDKKPLKEYS